jgi:acetamidase/formamidase
VQVNVLKGLKIGGPILLPPVKDLPHLARPLTAGEKRVVKSLAKKFGQAAMEDTAPLQMVGSGANLNDATDNGVTRLTELFKISKEEVLNRVTLAGAVEIGRLPGVVTVTMQVPLNWLKKVKLAELVKKHYAL